MDEIFKSQILDDFDYYWKKRARKRLLESLSFLPNRFKYTIGIFCTTILRPFHLGYFQYRRFYNFLEKSQWWSQEELKEYQKEKLIALLHYVYENIPYYRGILKTMKLMPGDFVSLDDLSKLPILTKEDVMNNLDKLISNKVQKKYLMMNYTSGSTGKPMFLYFDQRARFIDWSFFVWIYKLAGINTNDKYIRMWSRPFIEKNIKSIYLHEPFHRRLSLSTLPSHSNKLEEYLRLIKEFRPVFIIGSPSFFYQLACYAQNRENITVNFHVLFSTYENLYSFQRNLIESQFHCEVFNHYSSQEHLINATECDKHEGMHIDMRRCITEVVNENGEVLNNEHQGRIICTGLHNYVMPLIRYDMGDIGSISNRKCSCGRGLPILKSLDGRNSEFIRYNGKFIYSATLSVILERFKNIKECQFIQDCENGIKVNIVKRKDYSERDTQELIRTLRNMIDGRLDVVINFTDHIPRTKMGKFPFVVCRIK